MESNFIVGHNQANKTVWSFSGDCVSRRRKLATLPPNLSDYEDRTLVNRWLSICRWSFMASDFKTVLCVVDAFGSYVELGQYKDYSRDNFLPNFHANRIGNEKST